MKITIILRKNGEPLSRQEHVFHNMSFESSGWDGNEWVICLTEEPEPAISHSLTPNFVSAKRQIPSVPWAVEARMKYITGRLSNFGAVNRRDIMEAFDVSVVQASKDIQFFMKLNPGRVVYDRTKKHYRMMA